MLCVGLAEATVKFKVLHFNDFHARIEPDSEGHGHCFRSDKEQGGLVVAVDVKRGPVEDGVQMG